MGAQKPVLACPVTLVMLATVLLVFVSGMVLAPELIGTFAPACMAVLAGVYVVFSWIERRL